MARRKYREEEHHSHERWLVSYADFITLLFAFFVVMYSISQVNEGKYRVLSNSFSDVFAQPAVDDNPIQVGSVARSNPTSLIELQAIPVKAPEPNSEEAVAGKSTPPAAPDLERLSAKIQAALGDLIKQGLVTVHGNESWLEITLSSSLLFNSGDSAISEGAFGMLAQISAILREQNNPVRVEGFTDDVPIHTVRFSSNWELSSARAAAVVQVLVGKGMDPEKLMAVGYGQYQAVAENKTPEDRAKNRRVVLMVSRGGELRPQLAPLSLAPNGEEMAPPARE